MMRDIILPKVMPILETERVLLREIDLDDLESYFALCSEKATMRAYGVLAHKTIDDTKKTIEFLREEFEAGRGMRFGVFVKPSLLLIGDGGFWQFDRRRRRAEIGGKILLSHAAKGYMTEVCSAIIRYGFLKLNIHAVEANVDVENVPSQKVLTKLGFHEDGMRREFSYCAYDDSFKNGFLFSLLKHEIRSAHE